MFKARDVKFCILNLGCGSKTSSHPAVLNIDWSIVLRVKRNKLLYAAVRKLLDSGRRERFDNIPDNILVHNLARGIPFPDESIDVVYHSHVLEHFDRRVAERFLSEAKRVLKPGGIHRIVVPDFEYLCRCYINNFDKCATGSGNIKDHEDYIADIIEQSVRRESFGSSKQGSMRRYLENLFLGDARKRGETHQWMYDRITLSEKLTSCGYRDITDHQYNTSQIGGWNDIGLDLDVNGKQYKAGSLYVEAIA